MREQTLLRLPAGGMDLPGTLDCGQAFRWRPGPEGWWEGVAGDRPLRLCRRGEALLLEAPPEDEAFWRRYLDLDRDYGAIARTLSQDPAMARALEDCPGIRVLRQDPWETLCTFIISANNHIPRIRGIVQRLCQGWGAPLGEDLWGFPPPERLASLTLEDLAPLRAGYRAPYLLETARQVAEGEVDLARVDRLPTPEALGELQRFKGVGVKVASCVLLFAYGRLECVPVDVWIGRVLERLYPQGFPDFARPWAGVAQQVLFQEIRQHPQFGLE